MTSFLLSKYLGRDQLNYIIMVYLTLQEYAKLFCEVPVPFCPGNAVALGLEIFVQFFGLFVFAFFK